MALIGLDVGTSGCKASVFTVDGALTTYAYRTYAIDRPRPGWFELDPELVWQKVQEVIGEAAEAHEGEPVTALSISSFGEAAVLVDKEGRTLAPSILYMDTRGREECRALEETLGRETIMELTGIPAHPMYTINKLMWLRQNQPELFAQAHRFLLFGDYVAYRLTGETVIDYSLASRTMAFNVVEKRWEPRLLDAAGLSADQFSAPKPSATAVGCLRPPAAEALGLPAEVRVVTGGHDQICAALGAGILAEGLAIDGIGTVECITPVFQTPLRGPEMLKNGLNCAPHAKDGLYASYAFNFTGGGLLQWYRDNFAQHEVQQAQAAGENVYARLDAQAAEAPTSLLVLPHFLGAGTPHMDPESQGAIVGLTMDHTWRDVYRALLEGVTYEMALNLECLAAAGVHVHTLRAVGGGAKSDVWLQIKADIMQRDIERLDVGEAGTLGTAIMAGTATGVYSSLDEAATALIRVQRTFSPQAANAGQYADNYRRYKRLYGALQAVIKGEEQ